jgi:hypothetical protein
MLDLGEASGRSRSGRGGMIGDTVAIRIETLDVAQ